MAVNALVLVLAGSCQAFDTVDHSIPTERLRQWVGAFGSALDTQSQGQDSFEGNCFYM